MGKWLYTVQGGKALREAIKTNELTHSAYILVACLRELNIKLSDEDKDWKGWDIEELIDRITSDIDCNELDEDTFDDYLDEFYDICDDVRAWIEI